MTRKHRDLKTSMDELRVALSCAHTSRESTEQKINDIYIRVNELECQIVSLQQQVTALQRQENS